MIRYRGNVCAVSEEELQAVGVGGFHRLADIYQPHLQQTHTQDEGCCLPLVSMVTG